MPTGFEAGITRKVAWRLVPFLSFAYPINALDRFNISMAVLTMNKVAWPLGHRLRARCCFSCRCIAHDATRNYQLQMLAIGATVLLAGLLVPSPCARWR